MRIYHKEKLITIDYIKKNIKGNNILKTTSKINNQEPNCKKNKKQWLCRAGFRKITNYQIICKEQGLKHLAPI